MRVMPLLFVLLALGLTGCCGVVTPYGQIERVNGQPFQPLSYDYVDCTAGEHLRSMAQELLTPSDGKRQESHDAICGDQAQDLRASIRFWRDKWRENGLEYSNASVGLEIVGQDIENDGRLHVRVLETTELVSNVGSETYATNHDFVYELAQGEWELIEDRIIDGYGLLPDGDDSYRYVVGE